MQDELWTRVFDPGLAYIVVRIGSGVGRQRQRRAFYLGRIGIGGHGALLRPRAEVGIVEFVPVRDPVALRLAVEDRVEERGHQAPGNPRPQTFPLHDESDLLLRHERTTP